MKKSMIVLVGILVCVSQPWAQSFEVVNPVNWKSGTAFAESAIDDLVLRVGLKYVTQDKLMLQIYASTKGSSVLVSSSDFSFQEVSVPSVPNEVIGDPEKSISAVEATSALQSSVDAAKWLGWWFNPAFATLLSKTTSEQLFVESELVNVRSNYLSKSTVEASEKQTFFLAFNFPRYKVLAEASQARLKKQQEKDRVAGQSKPMASYILDFKFPDKPVVHYQLTYTKGQKTATWFFTLRTN